MEIKCVINHLEYLVNVCLFVFLRQFKAFLLHQIVSDRKPMGEKGGDMQQWSHAGFEPRAIWTPQCHLCIMLYNNYYISAALL